MPTSAAIGTVSLQRAGKVTDAPLTLADPTHRRGMG
jgi:hypothetical protein